ncbi:hypothetical protein ACJX0J_029316, partial [Zea mays]
KQQHHGDNPIPVLFFLEFGIGKKNGKHEEIMSGDNVGKIIKILRGELVIFISLACFHYIFLGNMRGKQPEKELQEAI